MTDQVEREAEAAWEQFEFHDLRAPIKEMHVAFKAGFKAGFKAARATEPRPELEPSITELVSMVHDWLPLQGADDAHVALAELARRLEAKP